MTESPFEEYVCPNCGAKSRQAAGNREQGWCATCEKHFRMIDAYLAKHKKEGSHERLPR